MNNEKECREAFEAHYEATHYGCRPAISDDDIDCYADPFAQREWKVWQAAWSAAQAEKAQQPQIKTWQERCDWTSSQPVTKLMVEAMEAEIAELRAQQEQPANAQESLQECRRALELIRRGQSGVFATQDHLIRYVLSLTADAQQEQPAEPATVNHKEALELACLNRVDSNLARCYIDLHNRFVAQQEQPAQQPCARLHITLEDDSLDVRVEVLDGAALQPEMSPVDVYAQQEQPQEKSHE